MYFRVEHIEKIEQELAEENEMNNIRRVLQLLINEDAFCRECVIIEAYIPKNHSKLGTSNWAPYKHFSTLHNPLWQLLHLFH